MKILITGGTGLVGTHLSVLLKEKGYEVALLSRTPKTKPLTFTWDIPAKKIDTEALLWADAVIHLAGAGVAEKSWSSDHKRDILESRTHSSKLLANTIAGLPIENRPKIFIAASAVGYYGLDTGNELMRESAPAGKEFLADVTKQWETENNAVASLGIRTCLLRVGVVLAKEAGALPKMTAPIRWGAGAALGSGKQYISWIHITDLARMFCFALENTTLEGVYNAVAPLPATNTELTKAIAQTLHKPLLLPAVPSFVLYGLLGEMAGLVLGGNRVASEKIQKEGFQFSFPTLEGALKDLFEK